MNTYHLQTTIWQSIPLTTTIVGSGIFEKYKVENGVGELHYLYRDHLGSIVTITDDDGNVEHEQNFDPWGRYRDAYTWDYLNNGLDIDGDQDNDNIADWVEEIATDDWAWFARGYTGHACAERSRSKMLPQFGLINMNGRAYDPVLGRMLQVDNYIQNPFSSQSYNRYSYVLNNPMKYVDPDGEFPIVFAMIIGGIIHSGIEGVTKGHENMGSFLGSFAKGAAIGGAIYGGANGITSYIAGKLLPSIPIYQSKSFNLSVSPLIGNGSSGLTVGAHVNVSGQVNDFVYSASVGAGINSGVSTLGSPMGAGGYSNYSFFAGVNDGHANYGIGYSKNSFGGDLDQKVSAFTAQLGDFSFRFDEDLFNHTDKYRTGGMLMTYRIDKDIKVAFGAFMMTGMENGDPIKGGNPESLNGKGLYTGEDHPNLRAGALFGGIIYNEQASFVGSNSERRLHHVQNWIHSHITKVTPFFPESNTGSGYYGYYGGYHSNYLFY